MPKHEIVRKRVTPKILIELYPQPVVDKILEVANEYGNKGETGIKSFLPQTVDTNHYWYTREGDKYIVLDLDGNEASVIGASDDSHKLKNKFQIPAGTFMIFITYHKKYIMKVYTCIPIEKLGPVNEELVAKLETEQSITGVSEKLEADLRLTEGINEAMDKRNKPSKSDAVLHLPKLDSETGEVAQAEIETLPEELTDPVIGDVAANPEKYDIQPTKRDPKVLEPRKRRTKPLEVKPITPKTAISNLKAKSPDGENLYHGEVIITGIGENEGKEVKATMKIGGRKWITLSGGWGEGTGNMKEIMGVFHTNFSREDGSWKGNEAGNGWEICEDWLKKISETK